MNIYEEIFHGREGATVKGHKWVTRTGTPGHYKYTYDDKDGDQRFSSSNPVRPSTASTPTKRSNSTASSSSSPYQNSYSESRRNGGTKYSTSPSYTPTRKTMQPVKKETRSTTKSSGTHSQLSEGAGRTKASRAKVTEKTKETCMEIIMRVMRRRVAQMKS